MFKKTLAMIMMLGSFSAVAGNPTDGYDITMSHEVQELLQDSFPKGDTKILNMYDGITDRRHNLVGSFSYSVDFTYIDVMITIDRDPESVPNFVSVLNRAETVVFDEILRNTMNDINHNRYNKVRTVRSKAGDYTVTPKGDINGDYVEFCNPVQPVCVEFSIDVVRRLQAAMNKSFAETTKMIVNKKYHQKWVNKNTVVMYYKKRPELTEKDIAFNREWAGKFAGKIEYKNGKYYKRWDRNGKLVYRS